MSICHVKMSCVFGVPNSKLLKRYKFNIFSYRFTIIKLLKGKKSMLRSYVWYIWHAIRNSIGITFFKSLTKSEILKEGNSVLGWGYYAYS